MKSLARYSFLRGELRFRGFPDYFYWAYLLKTVYPHYLACFNELAGGYSLEPPFRGQARFEDARLSGYVVISATHLRGSISLQS